MNIKDLSLVLLLSGFLVNVDLANAQDTTWDSSPVGECFEKIKPEKTEDTAVVFERGCGVGGQKYVWI